MDSQTLPSRERLIELMQSRDPALDGSFVIAVKTTGVYCLPSCRPPRGPKPENVTFYATPEEAIAAGFRPCKLCRPDDFYAGRDPDGEAMAALTRALAEEPARFAGVGDLAVHLGMSSGRLYGLCRRRAGSTPGQLLRRARLEAAMAGLAAGEQPITEVAFDAGYGSLSGFNAAFRRAAGVSPSGFRLARGGAG
jgi:AraC family transcriptional regulator of adaptative response / DNA-3-methyladenine glycosylase II